MYEKYSSFPSISNPFVIVVENCFSMQCTDDDFYCRITAKSTASHCLSTNLLFFCRPDKLQLVKCMAKVQNFQTVFNETGA